MNGPMKAMKFSVKAMIPKAVASSRLRTTRRQRSAVSTLACSPGMTVGARARSGGRKQDPGSPQSGSERESLRGHLLTTGPAWPIDQSLKTFGHASARHPLANFLQRATSAARPCSAAQPVARRARLPHVVSAPAVTSLVPHLGAVLCFGASSQRALDGGLSKCQDGQNSNYRGGYG
jgi:hypothetical protein